MKRSPRPVVSVSERDVVYTDAYFGASFLGAPADVAYLLAGILGSALASWYFVMTGSTFGLWKQRIKQADVSSFPVPDLGRSARTTYGRRISQLARRFHTHAPGDQDWKNLDQAVFDLYALDKADRVVVRDGLFRASWQWKQGQNESVAPASIAHLGEYAQAFCLQVDPWFYAANERRLRAEIYELEHTAPLRVIRFVLEEHPPPSVAGIVASQGSLSDLLARFGERLGVSIADDLGTHRELILTDSDEVVIVKPSARRYWLGVAAMADARFVLEESFKGDAA